ncbi:Bromodomain testis-specific protein [Hirschfeldia incana]|nr:Bromodomain testis-specific protein [Hirschfeldia incana]KAJ0230103.1 Bromodomain testis-specific protein [Hirschfeldia incana]
MPKRAAESPPSSETQGVKPADSFGDYRSQVSQLLSQEEKISLRGREATKSHSNTAIGDGMSHLKKEDLNVLLRQCVRDLTPEVNEMHMRVCSMKLFSDKATKCNVPAESKEATVSEDDVETLLSKPDIVKKLTSQYSNVLFHELEDMQQQLESLLDDVVATCRLMTRSEKRELQKAIIELPGGNRDRVAGIVEEHCRTSGKDFSDEVIANLDQSEDNVMLWRLHFYIGAVMNAQKLAS